MTFDEMVKKFKESLSCGFRVEMIQERRSYIQVVKDDQWWNEPIVLGYTLKWEPGVGMMEKEIRGTWKVSTR